MPIISTTCVISTAKFGLAPDRDPRIADLLIMALNRAPGDAVHDRLPVGTPRVLAPGIVERGDIHLLRMWWQMEADGVGKFVGAAIGHDCYGVTGRRGG